MKPLLPLILSCFLFACVDTELDDLTAYVTETKSTVYPVNDVVPALEQVGVISFTQGQSRDPFSQPQVDTAPAFTHTPATCPQPNFDREKGILEGYPLESMTMRGTFMLDDQLWALLQISGGELYRVKAGYYIGLNYGKITNVSNNRIDLLELATDQNGCWEERVTQINLVSNEHK